MLIDINARGIKHTNRTETLTRYFNDIRPKSKYMSNEEMLSMYKQYQEETDEKKKKAIMDKFLDANYLFVVSIAKRYANNENLMDIIQEGNIGMMRAFKTFDPSRENRFTSYAISYIIREINHYKFRDDSIVHKVNASKTYHIIKRAKDNLYKELNREPTLEEVKDYIAENYPIYKINDTADLVDVHMTYVDDNTASDNGLAMNAGEIAEFNSISASQNLFTRKSEKEHIDFLTDNLLKQLKPIERQVVEYTFGIGHYKEYTIKEISEILSYTTERIRQLKETSLVKLRKLYLKHYSH